MKVTGYQLKEAIKMKALELDTIQSQFNDSLHRFEDEEKRSPIDIVDDLRRLENHLVELQTAQDFFNLGVQCEVNGEPISLSQAIKAVGGAGRIAKMWRTAAQGEKSDRWERARNLTRNKEDESAIPTISKEEALNESRKSEKFAAQLRNAIAVGNSKSLEISWLTDEMFE